MPKESNFYLRLNGELGYKNFYGPYAPKEDLIVFLKLMHQIEAFPRKMVIFLNEKFGVALKFHAPSTSLIKRMVEQIIADDKFRLAIF